LITLPATILISSICGTSVSSGLISAGIGTLVFLAVTGFKAPVCTSNSGATVSAIVGALALSDVVEQQFTGVIIGGAVMALIYCIAGLLVKRYGTNWLLKLMPPIVSGTTVVVIGIVLGFFVPGYAQIGGEYSVWGVVIAFAVMLVTAITAHYGKGIIKTLPFLIGLVFGYVVAIILSVTNVLPLVDMTSLVPNSVFAIPDLAFTHLNFATFDWSTLPEILIRFGLVSIAAMTEHVADIQAVSQVIGTDLTKNPGLDKTLMGDGLSSLAGALTGAQCTTTYSEYTGTMAVSGVASVWITLATALTLIFLGVFTPFGTLVAALPNCVFSGVAICAYGLISATGMQTLTKSKIDFKSNKNRFIIAAMLICGTSGLVLQIGQLGLNQIVLAMIVGIVLNLVLRDKKKDLSSLKDSCSDTETN